MVVEAVPHHLSPDDLVGQDFDPASVDDGGTDRKPDPRKIARSMHAIGVPLDDNRRVGPVSQRREGEAVRGKVVELECHCVDQQLGSSIGLQHVVMVAPNRAERHPCSGGSSDVTGPVTTDPARGAIAVRPRNAHTDSVRRRTS